ncbi:DEAD/DEAH box helicase family protein [Salinimicrobium sediminilitoris]|uniref:DEAD/DEAH box helicase family protein n=1 Tax=Salinimicrobium sediminilitoris TaxID=2876715 RepID=UPI001E516040|nr:DEAD/DEAH box helicase family protein [Salinimicrobium sediminilitoris]MCC8360258.1 DEAD/DEAH box helicase family protein [Salinimicrobium sediminilitoris]
MNVKEKEILLKKDQSYISDSDEALRELVDINKNKYVRKDVTGMGGTTAVLNDTHQSWLVVSPNVGMIKSKANRFYQNQEMFFIYGKSEDKWRDVIICIENHQTGIIKVNTTPDQVVNVKNRHPKLYEWLRVQPVFVDEAHAYSADADYRKSFGIFMELIYKEWRAKFTLSTATPIFRHLTLPEDIVIEFIGIKREYQPKRILQYSQDLNDAFKFINEKVLEGILVCVFTNNPKIHMKQYKGLLTGNVVGESLRIKLQPMGKAKYDILDDSVFEENQVVFLSSANYAGTDIEHDCCIVIINEGRHKATTVNINNIVQAYGRCREVVHDALLINIPPSKDYVVPTIDNVEAGINLYTSSLVFYENQPQSYRSADRKNFTPHGYVNRNYIAQPVLETVNKYQLYNPGVLVETLAEYHFTLQDYQQLHVEVDSLEFESLTFGQRIENLLKVDSHLLWNDYLTIKKCVRIAQVGSFNYELALQYLSTFIMKEWNLKPLIEDLGDISVKPHRFYDDMESLFRLYTNLDVYCTQSLDKARLERAEKKWPSFYRYVARDLSGDFDGADRENLVREWLLLYKIHRLKNLKRKENITTDNMNEMDSVNRQLSLLEVPTDFRHFKPHIENKPHRVRDTSGSIIQTLKDLDYVPTEDELFDIGEDVKEIYKEIDEAFEKIEDDEAKKKFTRPNPNSRSINKKKLINAIGFLYYQHNYNVKETNNREYNPLTALPRKLRPFIPLIYVECDIVAANAQFTDRFLGCSNYKTLYERIAQAEGCTRHQAKHKYNKFLNNHLSRRNTSLEFYRDVCTYTPKDAKKLSLHTSKVQEGSYYNKMVRYEQELIDDYQDYLECSSYRFHDAVVVPLWEAEEIALPTNFNGYEFRLGYYTAKDTLYKGKSNGAAVVHHCPLNHKELVH